MLTIRLQRTGKKNNPDYRIILAEKTASATKKFVEILGSYNPKTKAFSVKNQDRLTYWIGQHVELSPTVHNLLVAKQILQQPKMKAFSVPKKEVAAPTSAQSGDGAPTAPVSEAPTESAEAAAPAEAQAEAPAEVSAEEKPSEETA